MASRNTAPSIRSVASRPRHRRSSVKELQQPRILMVDDDPVILECFSVWLERHYDAKISAFSSAEEAMAALTPDGFDVCILDYRLDGANGLTLGAMLREINPFAHLILLSGNLPPEIKSLAFEHGFGQVLVKPVSPERLIDAIRF